MCVYLKVVKENNLKANTTGFIKIALLAGLTLYQIALVDHRASAAPASNNQPLWEYQDLKCLDPWGDSDSNVRDAVAVYSKSDMQERESYSSYPNGHWLFFPYNTLTLKGTGSFDIGLTLSAGLYTGPVTPGPTNNKSDGDVAPFGNRDGVINVGDALVALRFALGMEMPTQEDEDHGDVAPLDAQGQPNPDGQINVGDALVILRKALGLISF